MMQNKLITGNEFKSVLLGTLKRLDEFCKQHDIKYTLAYGTALGAVRHKGFIPWDDDVDVLMMRSEYEKFEKAWKKYAEKNSDRYKLWAEMDEENYFMAFCAKFFDTNTILYERFGKKKVIEYGIFVDIFVLDHIPLDKQEQKRLFLDISFYRKWMQHFQRHFQKWNLFVKKYRLSWPSLHNLANRLMARKEKYNREVTSLVALIQDYNKKKDHNKSIYEYKWFSEFECIEFEKNYFPIIKEHHKMLEVNYGDYMTLPSEEDRKGHNIEAYWK